MALQRGCYDHAVALARLGQICLDCADPAGLAAFWAALLGGEVAPVSDDVVVVGHKGTPIAAVRVPDYRPPSWPSGEVPKQIHLDLAVSVGELDAAEAEAIRLGARRADDQLYPARWRVMLDPAGHPFCLCDWSQPLPANRKVGYWCSGDKPKSHPQIHHLERTVPFASTVTSLVISGSSRPSRNFSSNTLTDKIRCTA
jgi:Glyoxalase-like domain